MKISKEKALSVMESLLFMSAEPRPLSDFENLFEGEIPSQKLKELLEELKSSYDKKDRGIYLEKVGPGWQLKTKIENKGYLLKIRPKSLFRLSRPSLEALSIIAFEQPCPKIKVDEFRGVESGHLLRTLIEKGLICFAGKSDLPGKASLYKTTGKFLEIFGLESLKDLPAQEEIEELLDKENNKEPRDLRSLSKELSLSDIQISHSEDERENKRIKDSLKSLSPNVEFLEKAIETKENPPSASDS